MQAMMRLRLMLVWLVAAGYPGLTLAPPVAAQQLRIDTFPVTALVRGENVWLRADPAEATDIILYLDRGDTITITGDATRADGDDFFPVEVLDTGDSGWIRDLFIDPGSIGSVVDVSVETVAPEETVEIAPPAETPRARPARRNRTATTPTPTTEAPPPAEPAPTEAADVAPAEAISFSGTAATVTESFTVPSGLLTVTGSHGGAGNFYVLTRDEDGVETLIFNEVGVFEGQSDIEVPPESILVLDVDADGAWEIVVSPSY